MLFQMNNNNFVKPSCCLNRTYDSYEETCCGMTLFENPLVLNEKVSELRHLIMVVVYKINRTNRLNFVRNLRTN